MNYSFNLGELIGERNGTTLCSYAHWTLACISALFYLKHPLGKNDEKKM